MLMKMVRLQYDIDDDGELNEDIGGNKDDDDDDVMCIYWFRSDDDGDDDGR